GARSHAVDGILRVRPPFVEVRARGRGEMPPGGEAEDPEASRIEPELLRARTQQANRALRVLQGHGMAISGTHPVLQNERGDPEGVEPLRDVFALVSAGQRTVAAARPDEDGGAVRGGGGRAVDGD